jgi:hypothetical protein
MRCRGEVLPHGHAVADIVVFRVILSPISFDEYVGKTGALDKTVIQGTQQETRI